MFRYRHPAGKLRPFVNAGILNALAVKIGNEKIVDSHIYTDQRIENKKATGNFRKREFGFVFGIGAIMNHCSGELRYERGDGMCSYHNLKATSKSFNVLLG